MTKLLTSEDNIDTDDPTINSHSETLKRHLATFNLQLDRVQSDGDCAFRTIMRQVRKLVHNEAGQLSEHLRRLGLLNTEDLDTYTLRQLFVDAVLADDCSISNFVYGSQADVERKGHEFSVRGFFDHELAILYIVIESTVLGCAWVNRINMVYRILEFTSAVTWVNRILHSITGYSIVLDTHG